MDLHLQNKLALVTGSIKGIGHAMPTLKVYEFKPSGGPRPVRRPCAGFKVC